MHYFLPGMKRLGIIRIGIIVIITGWIMTLGAVTLANIVYSPAPFRNTLAGVFLLLVAPLGILVVLTGCTLSLLGWIMKRRKATTPHARV